MAENFRDLRDRDETNHMQANLIDKHSELADNIQTARVAAQILNFKVIIKHFKCITRQLHEAVRILRIEGNLINDR